MNLRENRKCKARNLYPRIFFLGACGFQLNQFADSEKNHWSNQLVIREEDLLAKSRQQCYHPIEMA